MDSSVSPKDEIWFLRVFHHVSNAQATRENYIMRSLMICTAHQMIKSRMRWAGQVARTVKRRGVYRVLVGTSEEKRPLGRPRRRWEDNIKMDLHAVGCVGMDWIELAQDRDRWRAFVSTLMNLRFP
jgi:hypothetical protein